MWYKKELSSLAHYSPMPFTIVRNNIVNMKVDAIVNTANPDPIIGTGVDTAIHTAAGPELLAARKKIGALDVGQAAMTPAFNLDAKYVIHAIGPEWQGGDHLEEFYLASCFMRSLELAQEAGCKSIAFPLMATGNYGFPKALALRIALDVFTEFLNVSEIDIYLVVFSKASFEISRTLFSSVFSFIDENYVREQTISEYGYLRESHIDSDDIREQDHSAEKCSSRWSKHASHTVSHKKTPPRFGMGSMASINLELSDEEKLPNKSDTKKKALEKREPTRLWGDSTAPDVHLSADMHVPSVKNAWNNILSRVEAGFSETLVSLISASGENFAAVYRRANVDRKMFSKIRSKKGYQPSKVTAISFALALRLNLEETKDFIARAGYALSKSS